MVMMNVLIFSVIFCALVLSFSQGSIIYDNLDCRGKTFRNVTLSAYYPDFESEDPNTIFDVRGKKLRSLQDYLDNRVDFITLAMDKNLHLPYGTPVCIPELNKNFGRKLKIQVRDKGSDLTGKQYSRADICVRTETDSYDNAVNRIVTLVF